MAIDLTGANRYATANVGDSTATQVRAPVGHVVKMLSASAVHVFSGVDDGGSIPAAASRVAYTASEMTSGISEPLGGPILRDSTTGVLYQVVNIASASGTVSVRLSCYPATPRV